MDKIILVNRSNPIPPGYLDTIEMVAVKVDEGFSVSLERETAERYLQMRRHLLSIGIRIEVVSGYRSQETQERIWNKNVAAHGEARTRRYVAMPGHSEHQTGLALDLTLYNDQGDIVGDDDVEAYARLLPYFPEFGFIVRYPAGKEDITGYRFEPWHIRYVGDEVAREIYASSLTLEEYVSCTHERLG